MFDALSMHDLVADEIEQRAVTGSGATRAAATLAHRDASLSHMGNGIYAEMWAAALVSSAFVAGSPAAAVQRSLAHIPPRSRLAEAVDDVVATHAPGTSRLAESAPPDPAFGVEGRT